MAPEMPGRPDRHQGLDDKIQSVTDGNTHTQPEVTVSDGQKPSSSGTDLDRVREELGKYSPDSPAYGALKGRESKLLAEQTPTSETEIRNEYGNPATNNTDNSRIRETDKLNDFTPELKQAQNSSEAGIRNEYGNPSSSSEMPASSDATPIDESPDSYRGPAPGDDPFANLRSGYSEPPTASETSLSSPGDSSEINGGSGSDAGGDGGGDGDI